ncbi:hypothetical protein [Brevibacillus sp. SYSU BS000544]|uniref:hypothetical protein n=1 Tax=Brevibacillus sp. SYSU BS000544 TaxID=3416443 RepID=UPI003CE57E43
MKITLAKNLLPAGLKVGDSVPFSERGMYIGNGIIVAITEDTYEIDVDNRVTENLERYGSK